MFFASRKKLFPASVLNVLLRLLIFLLFYPVNSGIQIYRHVNDTEITILVLNVPTHYKATPLCFRSEIATRRDAGEIMFYIRNISLGFHDSLLLDLFMANKWRRSWAGIHHVSLAPAWTWTCQEIFGPFFCFSTCKVGLRMMRVSFEHISESASELGRLLCFNHAHYVNNSIPIILTLLIEMELFHNYASVTERETWPQVLYVFLIYILCA